ncbi:gliding motility-associated-like protein [Tenacibaculum skagerrakense]|uniref:Gliding motility-associated-like protein n=1 Tax=Tenacibaculum skagerrakense TaxID=186571 RepID=A0A4R2NX85_9FLAO|nr:T9SS type B sorting domain-containing protein [Tenacibaculum skagerrakense]TCP26819.1 gliding motility-associated-like protein [Tenacibaculum skagerrakense]
MKKLILITVYFFTVTIFAQKQANIWYFGQNAGLDFSTTPPTPLTDGQLNTDEGCSSFSDKDGNLLFYSDGIRIFNKNHVLMTFTDGSPADNLGGNPSSTQSGMIIPRPGSDTIYYLFTVGTNFVPNGITSNPGFNFYTIDMSRNGGLGEIVDGPVNLAVDPFSTLDISTIWSEKVTAVKGNECDTFWVISFAQGDFYSFKVDVNGVDVAGVVVSPVNFSTTDKRGYLQVSPNGQYIAFADYRAGQQNIIGSAQLFNFDNQTGIVSPNPITLIGENENESPYGVAFSQQSNKLYVSTYNGTNSVYQFDLTNTNIPSTRSLINSKQGFRGGLQLGPDGKIYASVPNSNFLDVIDNPNDDANNVNYINDAIFLNGRRTAQGLPPFISSLLLPVEIRDVATNEILNNQNIQYCIGESVEISSEAITGTNIQYEWTFDDGISSSVVSTQPTLTLNNLNTSNSGTYSLVITLIDDCNNATNLEGSFNIGIFEPASASPVSDINFCDTDGDGFHSFDFQNDINPIVLGSLDPNQFEVYYFLNQSDADNNSVPSALNNPYTNATPFPNNQDIFVRVQNKDAPNACYAITQFTLSITALPSPSQPTDYEVCDDVANGGDTDGFYNDFLLSTKDSEVLGGLDPTLFNVSYHTTLSGAQTDNATNAIDKNNPYRNATINEQTIYVRIENVANTNCFTASDPATAFMPFRLVVNPLPVIANNPAQINQCDTDSDLTTNINLTQAEISISNNHTNETFQYYPTQADAIADTAQIADPVSHSASDGDSVWVRTISNQGCFRISRLDITISFAGDVAYNEEFTTCDDFLDADGNDTINNDDRDGIANFDISPAIDDIKSLFDPTIRNDLDVLFFETEADRDAVINQIPDPANYRNTNIPASTQQSIFVKIINRINNDCTGLGEFFIRVLPLPEFEITTPQIVCLNSPSFIEAEMPDGTYTYEWRRNGVIDTSSTSETLDITQGGTYEVTAINTTTNCTRTRRIIVSESIIATLTEDDVTIIDDSTNNSITIDNSNNNLGIGDYEFALQDESNNIIRDFQDTPMFESLNGGVYTILVRDKNGCGVAELEVSVLEFPKYFTPNNDGVNDIWVVKGASTTFYPQSSIHIFDRYGNPITEIAIDGQGWDGLYNGKVLPSNDYWFNIELTDRNGNKINRKGHFSLLRK